MLVFIYLFSIVQTYLVTVSNNPIRSIITQSSHIIDSSTKIAPILKPDNPLFHNAKWVRYLSQIAQTVHSLQPYSNRKPTE